MDIATFRAALPEFADTTKYPDALISFWLQIAVNRLNPSIWGSSLNLGLLWLTAHLVALAKRNETSGSGAGIPGSASVMSMKQLGPGQIGYNTTLGAIPGAGAYNLTSYGIEYYTLLRIVGFRGVPSQASPNSAVAVPQPDPNNNGFIPQVLG